MKLKICLLVTVLALTTFARGATNDLTGLLQQGLFEEEANRDLHAAISNYQSLATAFDKDRQLAATAIFRLGECYRKLSKTNDAVVQYQRILKEFGDQPTLVTLSRQNLTGLNAAALSPAVAADESSAVEAEATVAALQAQLEAIDKMTHDQRVVYVQQNSRNDTLDGLIAGLNLGQQGLIELKSNYSPDHPKYKAAQELVEDTKRKIDAQVQGIVDSLKIRLAQAQAEVNLQRKRHGEIAGTTGSGEESAVTDEEQQEIRRIQLMIQNSPDLINAPGQGINGKYTPLIEAAMKGQLVVAKYLLDHGADVNGLSSNHGDVPLTAAAENGHKAMVELLLARGADVSGRGLNPFYVAVSKGYSAVAEVLLANKADVNARSGTDNSGLRPIQVAARDGKTDLLRLLIQHGADINFTTGSTPLGLASGNNNIDCVKILLAAKADIEAKNENGNTALHEAASRGCTEVASLLLTSGATVDSTNRDDNTPLILAIRDKRTNAVRVLLEHKANPNRAGIGNSVNAQNVKSLPIVFAIWNRNNDILKLLLDAGANPEGESQYDNPLFAALGNNDANAAQLLLDHGANPNVRSRYGYSLLTTAVQGSGRDQFVAALLEKGADPNARDPDGGMPLFGAKTVEVVRMLIEHRAEVNAALSDGRTPLMTKGDTNIMAVLLESGARVDMQDTNGSTALHYSVWRASPEDVSVLLMYKANPNIQNTAGDTPLDLAQTAIRPTPIVPRNITDANNVKTIADLLVKAGGLANLPKRNRIEVRRASQSRVAFTKGSRDWNRYSLLEMIAGEYRLISQATSGEWQTETGEGSTIWQNSLHFPDFKHVLIYRRAEAAMKQKAIYVDVEDILSKGDCSQDTWLEWGDVVEIPESDHPVDQPWTGLGLQTVSALTNCLARGVTINIKGVSTPIRLKPEFANVSGNPVQFSMVREARISFMLRSVLDNSKLVRVSSDLSRVKVTRVDSETKKKQEWVIDCRNPSQADLWLRDGDVIEVPEK